jgi:hypothetical protein
VLIKGPAHAGKSRTAFETACVALPDYRLVTPRDRSALARLAAAEVATELDDPIVIWLDDLDRYLGAEGLDLAMLSAWARSGVSVKVLATIRLREHARLRTTPGEIGREILAVLNCAESIMLAAELRSEERSAAQELYYEEHFAGGLGEHLAAAHELVQKFDEGYDLCPEGYAVVQAAVDWRRAGLDRISSADLEHLYKDHLQQLRPLRPITAGDFQRGLAWATAIEGRTAALLVRDNDDEQSFRVSDYIVDYVERGGDA